MASVAVSVAVEWTRNGEDFSDGRYSRVHRWLFDGGSEVVALSSPEIVPVPMSDAKAVDPEEAFTASLSSCHMLWFLSLAARGGYRVNRYRDNAVAQMGRREDGRLVMQTVRLRPEIEWAEPIPVPEVAAALHEAAHAECFLANSVKTVISIESR